MVKSYYSEKESQKFITNLSAYNKEFLTDDLDETILSIKPTKEELAKTRIEALNKFKQYNMNLIIKFLQHEIDSHLLKDITSYNYKRFYDVFTSYLLTTESKCDITESRFCIDLKQFTSIVKKRSSYGVVYKVDFNLLKPML